MRKAIYLLSALVLLAAAGASAQTVASKEPLATAWQLYNAGQWAAAGYEADKAPRTVESETLSALCAARLGDPAAGGRLWALMEKYPTSPYSNEVMFRAGVAEYDAGRYFVALIMLREVAPKRLAETDRDEYHFKTGHSLFTAGNYNLAREEFARVSPESSFTPHAGYYIAYMEYVEGDLPTAKRGFEALAALPSYEKIVPFYLLQIEFLQGNHNYVASHAGALIDKAAMPRRTELTRMAAQSRFELEEYAETIEHIEAYRNLGGGMSREDNYVAGFALYREGRLREAADYFAAATGPDDSLSQNASYHMADIYLRLGDKGRAMQSFSIASASGHDPEIAEDALFNYGKLLYETGAGRFNEAVNVLGRYIATYPSSPHNAAAREYLIAAYYNSHDYAAAYEAIMQHPDPDNNVRAALQKITYFRALELWNSGDSDSAVEALTLLETSSKYRYNAKYTALAAFWQGEILYSQGNYTGAISRYEEYLRLSPTTEAENAIARYDLGYANFNLGRWNDAAKWFDDFTERYTTKDSYRADAFNRRADIDHAGRAYWRAIENYDAAAAVGTPERYYSAYQRALMLGLVERPERKVESLQDIISKGEGPYVEDATYELGRTHIVRESYADGARVLVGFIAKYPASEFYLPALSNLGLAYLNMGDRAQSMKYYKMIVERAPWSREAQDAMAGIRGLYVEEGDVDGYLAYVREAGVPTDVGEMQRDSLTFAAAERMYLSGDEARAIPALENYVRGDARGQYIPTALGYLSGLYFKTGRYGEAADSYRQLATIASTPQSAGRALEGYVSSVIRTKDSDRIVAMADEVSALENVPDESLRDALFAKAGVLRSTGREAEAVEIYRRLGDEVRTARGAESAFRIIESLYNAGDYAAAEEAVFALSGQDTPHGYWLAEAFLTLGDIYVRGGDTFQARATYQSIVDGYSPSDDGIIAAARERIANLK